MTKINKLVSVLAVVAASVSAFAQTQPANPANEISNGLLGTRYADVGLGFIDVNHSGTDAFGAGFTVNLPVVSNIDVAVNYSYAWVESYSDIDSHTLSVDGIYYINQGAFKPFGGVSVGYNWNDWDNESIWGAFGGIEFQLNPRVVLTASAGYDANFDDADEGDFNGTVAARYFFTKNVAAAVSVELIEGGHVGYTAGVTLKF